MYFFLFFFFIISFQKIFLKSSKNPRAQYIVKKQKRNLSLKILLPLNVKPKTVNIIIVFFCNFTFSSVCHRSILSFYVANAQKTIVFVTLNFKPKTGNVNIFFLFGVHLFQCACFEINHNCFSHPPVILFG